MHKEVTNVSALADEHKSDKSKEKSVNFESSEDNCDPKR